jgi:hypothetical protein
MCRAVRSVAATLTYKLYSKHTAAASSKGVGTAAVDEALRSPVRGGNLLWAEQTAPNVFNCGRACALF